MARTDQETPRTHLLVDKQWQLAAGTSIAMAAIPVGSLWLLACYFLTSPEWVASLSSRQTWILSVFTNALCFALLLSFLVYVTIRLTHRVAGPAMVIERAVAALRRGRFDSRMKLRKHDYLQSLAAELAGLTADLEHRRDEELRLLSELEAALLRMDTDVVQETVRALRRLGTWNDAKESQQQAAKT